MCVQTRSKKYLGVYYLTSQHEEDNEMWSTVFSTNGGVNFFYSD